jgi:Uma2 family endonuclease
VPGINHQYWVKTLCASLFEIFRQPEQGTVLAGTNVSDVGCGWRKNYHCSDVAVYLNSSTAMCHQNRWQGGPDLAIEIISRGDLHKEPGVFRALPLKHQIWKSSGPTILKGVVGKI